MDSQKTLPDPRWILWGNMLLYAVIFIVLSIWKYSHFFYDNLDLAIFNQVFWTTSHYMPFAATIHPPTYLVDHFKPMIVLLAPFYLIYPRPEWLLIFQTVVIALTAIPIYRIALQTLGDRKKYLALLPALLWLWNPLTHNMNFFEFHLVPLGVFFIFWIIDAYLKKRELAFVLFFLAGLLVREDMALVLFFFSVIALIQRRKLFWVLVPALA